MNVRAVSYQRQSVHRDGSQSESVERQAARCQELAATRGLTIVRSFHDLDISAYTGKRRPGFEEMLQYLSQSKATDLIADELNRLTRKGLRGISEIIAALRKSGGRLHLVHGNVDLAGPMGEGILALYASIAEEESLNTSRRVASFHLQQAERGMMHTGASRAYGQERDGSWVPKEATHIRTMFNMVLAGDSRRKIAKHLNENGILSARQSAWSSSSVGMLLRQNRLRGIRDYNGQEFKAIWSPLFSEQEWLQLQSALDGSAAVLRQRRSGPDAPLLGGLVKCALCGSPMRWALQQGKHARYRCDPAKPSAPTGLQYGCNRVTISQPFADAYAIDEIAKAHKGGNLHPLGFGPQMVATITQLQERLDDAETRLHLWDEAFLQKQLPPAAWQPGRLELVEQAKTAEAALNLASESSEPGPNLGEDPHAWFASASWNDKRAAVVGSLRRVDVRPAKDPYEGGSRLAVFFRLSRLVSIGEAYVPTAG